MKLIDTIYKCIHEYPSLFYYTGHPTLSDFEISRLAVLDHLFMVNGNGYCWVDGYLCHIEDADGIDFEWPLGYTATSPLYGELQYSSRIFPPERIKVNGRTALFAGEFYCSSERQKEFPFAIYPISDSYTLRFPSGKVQKDWLEGARDICQFSIDFFSSRNRLDGNNRRTPYADKRKSLSFLRKKLREINFKLLEEE